MVKIENQKTTGTLTNEAINILSDALPKTAIQKLSPALLFFFRQ